MKTGLGRAFPYNEDWAKEVFLAFQKSNPRAGNLLLIAVYEAKKIGLLASTDLIRGILIADIRSRGRQELWNEFKKASKHWANWDIARKEALFLKIGEKIYRVKEEKAQYTLDI